MILAELEIFHSRAIAPTRRVALGALHLPVLPAPGFGGILLGGIVATYAPKVDPDILDDYGRLLRRLLRNERVPQPQCRHRFQHDRIGLISCRHRLRGENEQLSFDLHDGRGTPVQHLLGAAYAADGVEPEARSSVIAAMQVALQWPGAADEALIARLSGRLVGAVVPAAAVGDPLGWARMVLDLTNGAAPTRRQVQRAFRDGLRDVHPDLGADGELAARRIADLSEARRILLGAQR